MKNLEHKMTKLALGSWWYAGRIGVAKYKEMHKAVGEVADS